MPPCLPLRCVPPSCRCSVAESPILQHAGAMSSCSRIVLVPGAGAGAAWCAVPAWCCCVVCCLVCSAVAVQVLLCSAVQVRSVPGVLRCAGVRSVSFAHGACFFCCAVLVLCCCASPGTYLVPTCLVCWCCLFLLLTWCLTWCSLVLVQRCAQLTSSSAVALSAC